MGEANLDPGVSSLLHPHLVKEGRAAPIFLLAMRTAPRMCVQRVRIQVRVRRKGEGGMCAGKEKLKCNIQKWTEGIKGRAKEIGGWDRRRRVGPQPI